MQPTHPADARVLVARRMAESEAGAARERLVTSAARPVSLAARLRGMRRRRWTARRGLVVTWTARGTE